MKKPRIIPGCEVEGGTLPSFLEYTNNGWKNIDLSEEQSKLADEIFREYVAYAGHKISNHVFQGKMIVESLSLFPEGELFFCLKKDEER